MLSVGPAVSAGVGGRLRAPEGRRSVWLSKAAGALTSLSWSRELLVRELVASWRLSSPLWRSPPLDAVTFIWGQGEAGSANTDPSPLPVGAGRGPSQGQAPHPCPALLTHTEPQATTQREGSGGKALQS